MEGGAEMNRRHSIWREGDNNRGGGGGGRDAARGKDENKFNHSEEFN